MEKGKSTKRVPKQTVIRPPRGASATRSNYRAMNRQEYFAIRQYDWYENVPRDEHIEDPNFWCQEQIHIYQDVYLHFQKPIRPMQPYRSSDIQAKPTFA